MTVVNEYSNLTFTEFVDRTVTEHATPAVLPIRATGTQVPVYCIHPLEGVTECYAELAARLGENRPVFSVEAASAQRPESLTALASHYADAVLAVHGFGPMHLVGLSFGGLLAHAVAIELQHRGIAVASLALLGSNPLRHDDEASHETLTRMGDGIDRSRAEELLAFATHNEALAHNHFPGVFVGKALIVSDVANDIGPAWHTFVSGTLTKYNVPDFSDFSLVGPVLNSYI